MPEETPRKPEHIFLRKGERVQLRSDISPQDIKLFEPNLMPNVTYRIFRVERHTDEGGDSVWLGPGNASDADIETFELEKLNIKDMKRKFPNVLPVSAYFIEKTKK